MLNNLHTVKYKQLKCMVLGIIDILVITATKLNATFPEANFLFEGFSKPIGFIIVIMEGVL